MPTFSKLAVSCPPSPPQATQLSHDSEALMAQAGQDLEQREGLLEKKAQYEQARP